MCIKITTRGKVCTKKTTNNDLDLCTYHYNKELEKIQPQYEEDEEDEEAYSFDDLIY
jgi:hypothetical protein